MKRIERIINIISDEEQKATTEMVNCQNYCDEQSNLLENLVSYEEEYKKNFSSSASAGVAIQYIHNYNNFMVRLKLTTQQQGLNVEQAKKRLAAAIATWQLKKKKRLSLENLNTRLDIRSQNELSLQEQKDQDEMASLKFRLGKSEH